MSRSEQDKLEAQREARRAKRLSERAEQRARRKADQAKRAAQRAEQLAEEAKRPKRSGRSSPRHRDFERSIEDVVDDVADKWTRKAENWMDEQSQKLRDSSHGMSGRSHRSDYSDLGDDYSDEDDSYFDYDDTDESYSDSKRRVRRRERLKRRKARIKAEFGFERERKHWKRRNRNGNLYRDPQNKKILGVCAGVADYWAMETWQVRFIAVVALFVVPSVAIPGYFIASFLMDNKPYYKKVTDRFHELDQETMSEDSMGRVRSSVKGTAKTSRTNRSKSTASNGQALKTAKTKFADIEDRLRVMETHVTSPRFELQRELRKIAGDEG